MKRILFFSSGTFQAFFSVWIKSDHLSLSARSLDLFLGGGGEGRGPNGQLLGQSAVAQYLHAILALGKDTLLQQVADIDGTYPLRLDRNGLF